VARTHSPRAGQIWQARLPKCPTPNVPELDDYRSGNRITPAYTFSVRTTVAVNRDQVRYVITGPVGAPPRQDHSNSWQTGVRRFRP
jgi:hypothetical protein